GAHRLRPRSARSGRAAKARRWSRGFPWLLFYDPTAGELLGIDEFGLRHRGPRLFGRDLAGLLKGRPIVAPDPKPDVPPAARIRGPEGNEQFPVDDPLSRCTRRHRRSHR